MRSLYASVLGFCLAGQVSSVEPDQIHKQVVNVYFTVNAEDPCTSDAIAHVIHQYNAALNSAFESSGVNVEASWTNTGPQENVHHASEPLVAPIFAPAPLEMVRPLCSVGSLIPTNIAGHSCMITPGRDRRRRLTGDDHDHDDDDDDEDEEEEDSHGESIFGFTEEDCAAVHGYWEGYGCEGTVEVVEHPEIQAHPEFLDALIGAWEGPCCSEGGQAPLVVAANNAGASVRRFHFNTQNVFGNKNIFGDVTEGMKIFTGHLVVSVNNPVALIGNGTANATVKEALRAGIAGAIPGVEASMVKILSVRPPQRRLASSSRRLSGDLTVNYIIKAPPTSSLTASQIGAVGDGFRTALNTQFQSAGIAVAVEATQSPIPIESVASTTVPPPTVDPASVDACQMPVASSTLAMALMLAIVAKEVF